MSDYAILVQLFRLCQLCQIMPIIFLPYELCQLCQFTGIIAIMSFSTCYDNYCNLNRLCHDYSSYFLLQQIIRIMSFP